jgi:hypothetical protein
MTTAYRIYSNDGAGGPVDFSAPVASTAALSYVAGPLGAPTDTTFVVHAYDPDTGLEEANTEASVRLVVAADGTDVSGLPNPPHALTLSPAFGGGGRVGWAYAPAGAYGLPAGFNVYLTEGPAVDYTSPAVTVPYSPGVIGYSCVLPGPFTPSAYTAGVRSYNATGVEANTGSVTGALGIPAPYAMDPVQVIIGTAGR